MKKNNTAGNGKPNPYSWVIKVFIITIVISAALSLVAESSMHNLSLPLATVVLFMFVFLGVFFDALGVAIATVSLTPFVSMSSKRIKGADEAMFLIKRADIVSNLCNDVIGDICGIISGSAGGIIGVIIIQNYISLTNPWVSVIISAIIASLTVSGKALGKIIAMKDNRQIVLAAGRVLHTLSPLWKRRKK